MFAYLHHLGGPSGASRLRKQLSSLAAGPAAEPIAWQVCVGLEIHAQIKSKSKAFSPAPVSFAAAANSNVDFLDAGYPGTLPVLNRRCVEAGLLTSLALGCRINQRSLFDRKHYFYADMPSGYQITQQRIPIAEDGVLRIGHGESEKVVNIERLHLEHDSGKSIHTVSDEYTLVDLNRSGTGLMEIVTKPDIHSGEEAALFLQQLLLILEALGTCDGNLAEGSARVDANVSVRPAGATEYGDRCEVKNINGVRFLSKAIEYERDRQIGLLEDGQTITMSTRNYDVATNTTVRIRGKEDETDYRYMPEPDLPPLFISEQQLADAKRALPILPRESVGSLVHTYGLGYPEAWVLFMEPGAPQFYEACVEGLPDRLHQAAYNWVTSELYGILKAAGSTSADMPITPYQLRELVELVDTEVLSGLLAKKVLAVMVAGDPRGPRAIADEMGLVQISDTGEIELMCQQVLEEFPSQTAEYVEKGDPKLIKFFIGQAMRKSRGKANPKVVQPLMKKLLDKH